MCAWHGLLLQPYLGVLDARQVCRAQDAPLPLFDQVQAEHVVPGITALVAQLNAEIDALEQRVVPTWGAGGAAGEDQRPHGPRVGHRVAPEGEQAAAAGLAGTG